jgi:hypothetical protein
LGVKPRQTLAPSAPKAFDEFAFIMEAAQEMLWARTYAQATGRNKKRVRDWTAFSIKA